MTYEIDLSGRRALVTGAGQGVRREIASTLAEAGAEVFVNDLVAERADDVAAEITAHGGLATGAAFDVTDYGAVTAALPAMIDAQWGRVVTVISDTARVGETHMPAYFAAKAGAAGFCRSVPARSAGTASPSTASRSAR